MCLFTKVCLYTWAKFLGERHILCTAKMLTKMLFSSSALSVNTSSSALSVNTTRQGQRGCSGANRRHTYTHGHAHAYAHSWGRANGVGIKLFEAADRFRWQFLAQIRFGPAEAHFLQLLVLRAHRKAVYMHWYGHYNFGATRTAISAQAVRRESGLNAFPFGATILKPDFYLNQNKVENQKRHRKS